MKFSITILSLLLSCAQCFIIPEELPSLLSLIYSNIPPVKKGTDSRIGLGFRLGPHADFQVLLELGPQTNTDPLSSATENPSKRDVIVMKNPQGLLSYAGKVTNIFSSEPKKTESVSTGGGKWIDWWRNTVLSQNQIGKVEFNKVPGIDDLTPEGSSNVNIMEKDPSIRRNSIVEHLRQLYKEQPKKN